MFKSKTYENDEARDRDCKEICKSGLAIASREGWEFWRAFGEMRHVYAFLLKGGKRIRLVGPARSPTSFSVRSERKVVA
jgi:hypothetical protein